MKFIDETGDQPFLLQMSFPEPHDPEQVPARALLICFLLPRCRSDVQDREALKNMGRGGRSGNTTGCSRITPGYRERLASLRVELPGRASHDR